MKARGCSVYRWSSRRWLVWTVLCHRIDLARSQVRLRAGQQGERLVHVRSLSRSPRLHVVRCQLEELHQRVVGCLDVLVARLGSKTEPAEQLLLDLGRVCTTPHGHWMTTHACFPSFFTHPDVTVAVWLSQLVSI